MSFFSKVGSTLSVGRRSQERTHAHYSFHGDRSNREAFTMSTADRLLEHMFSWIEQREGCARQLQKLADKLEPLRKSSKTWLQSGTMKKAKEIDGKGMRIKEDIQRLFSQLREQGRQAASCDDPDDLDRHIMSVISGAMARRNGLEHHFTKKIFQKLYFSFCATSDESLGDDVFITDLTIKLAGILSFFTLEASGRIFTSLFAKGAEQLVKEITTAGLDKVLKGDMMAVGGVIGLAFDLPEAIDHWRDLIERNNVTEASQSLRDTADALLRINNALENQLDMIKLLLVDVVTLVTIMEIPNRSDQQKAEFIEVIRRHFPNQNIVETLMENEDIFFKLVNIFHFLKTEIEGKKWKIDQKIIDIIFVAHGSIAEPLIPASALLPLPTIEDVILYSPWNCVVDAKVVYGIATGRLQTQHRVFCCRFRCHCSNNLRHHLLTQPQNWNSMRDAGDSEIANIFVSPLRHPHDPAWNRVLFLEAILGEPGRNRVVIPYIIPGYQGNDKSMTIPFSLVIQDLSLVLLDCPFRARVHLGACLERTPRETLTEDLGKLAEQYTVTSDFTMMTSSDTVYDEYPWLYDALRAEFD